MDVLTFCSVNDPDNPAPLQLHVPVVSNGSARMIRSEYLSTLKESDTTHGPSSILYDEEICVESQTLMVTGIVLLAPHSLVYVTIAVCIPSSGTRMVCSRFDPDVPAPVQVHVPNRFDGRGDSFTLVP